MENLTYNELLIEVAKRKFAKMNQENVRTVLGKDNCVNIQQLPKLRSLVKMRHAKIISVLRFFPLCDHFGKTEAQFHAGSLTKAQAFDLAAGFISQRQSFHSMEHIGETESCLEASVARYRPESEAEEEEAMAARALDQLAAELAQEDRPMGHQLGASSDSSMAASESSEDVGPSESEEEAKMAEQQGMEEGLSLDPSALKFLVDAGILQ